MDEQFRGIDSIYVYLWLAFNAWMVFDAIRRRAASYWYFIILFFPLGALVYLFFVKLRDVRFDSEDVTKLPGERLSSPSRTSIFPFDKLDLDRADRLEEADNFDEALPIYRRALEQSATNPQALHGLGRCLLGLGRASESLVHFAKLLELDREYRNYSAALDYADALWESNQRNDTLELLERLAEHTGRINHRLALAHYLAESGALERARQEIKSALESAARNPDASSVRGRQWIERGEQMLAELENRDVPPTV